MKVEVTAFRAHLREEIRKSRGNSAGTRWRGAKLKFVCCPGVFAEPQLAGTPRDSAGSGETFLVLHFTGEWGKSPSRFKYFTSNATLPRCVPLRSFQAIDSHTFNTNWIIAFLDLKYDGSDSEIPNCFLYKQLGNFVKNVIFRTHVYE